MAKTQTVTYSNKPLSEKQKATDFSEHERTYRGFLFLAKWSVIAIVIVLLGLYIFLVA